MNTINIKALSEEVQKLETKVKEAVELPSVETTDEGKVLTVDSEGHWVAENLPPYPVGNLDYSTTEQDTGVKWIDGKSIYQIVLSGETPTSEESGKTFPLSFYKVVGWYGTYQTTDGFTKDINRDFQLLGNTSKTAITMNRSSTASSQGAHFDAIVLYTKPAASREPDDEPETKKATKKKTTK